MYVRNQVNHDEIAGRFSRISFECAKKDLFRIKPKGKNKGKGIERKKRFWKNRGRGRPGAGGGGELIETESCTVAAVRLSDGGLLWIKTDIESQFSQKRPHLDIAMGLVR